MIFQNLGQGKYSVLEFVFFFKKNQTTELYYTFAQVFFFCV